MARAEVLRGALLRGVAEAARAALDARVLGPSGSAATHTRRTNVSIHATVSRPSLGGAQAAFRDCRSGLPPDAVARGREAAEDTVCTAYADMTKSASGRSSHPGWLRRPALERRLDEAFARRVTTLTADAGFGKSTLLAAWTEDVECIWYTAGANDAALPPLTQGIADAIRSSLPG